MKRHLPSAAFVGLTLLAVAGVAGAFVYSGAYDIGADAPHSTMVFGTLETLRERAIAHHARNIVPPKDFSSAGRVAKGAGLYAEMCTGCHLGPGVEKSELSQGLYPAAPELAEESDLTPAQQFWIIKHGVKLSAMPAWGKTHNDDLIWDMVAFLKRLPKLSPQQYAAMVESAPADHDEMMRDRPAIGGAHEEGVEPHEHAPPHEHTTPHKH